MAHCRIGACDQYLHVYLYWCSMLYFFFFYISVIEKKIYFILIFFGEGKLGFLNFYKVILDAGVSAPLKFSLHFRPCPKDH